MNIKKRSLEGLSLWVIVLVDKGRLQRKFNKFRCSEALKNGKQCIGTSTENSESHPREMTLQIMIRMEMLYNQKLSKIIESLTKKKVRDNL